MMSNRKESGSLGGGKSEGDKKKKLNFFAKFKKSNRL